MSKTPDGKEPTPVATPAVRKIGTAKGDFEVREDFDAPLADQILGAFEE